MNLNRNLRKAAILPVIHVEALGQARENAVIAQDCGADGIFLINHAITDRKLLEIHDNLAANFPDFWMGVNCLGLSPESIFTLIPETVRGVWVDNSYVNERSTHQTRAEQIDAIRKRLAPSCLYFGGVAFKYQRHVNDLETSCELAKHYVDIVTTSGPGTGEAADLNKIRRMKSVLGSHPLAVASGITVENVNDYLPHMDFLLVATGISQSFTQLDSGRLRSLIARVESFRK